MDSVVKEEETHNNLPKNKELGDSEHILHELRVYGFPVMLSTSQEPLSSRGCSGIHVRRAGVGGGLLLTSLSGRQGRQYLKERKSIKLLTAISSAKPTSRLSVREDAIWDVVRELRSSMCP